MNPPGSQVVLNFCLIQLELLKEREMKLRKEIVDCEIQREFLTATLEKLRESPDE